MRPGATATSMAEAAGLSRMASFSSSRAAPLDATLAEGAGGRRSVSGGVAAPGLEGMPRTRARRPIGDWVLHAPQTLRALVRADEIWLVVLAAIIGCAAGLSVIAMGEFTQRMHEILFRLGPRQHLSSQVSVDPAR